MEQGAQFIGRDFADHVRLRIFPSHLEISIVDSPAEVAIKVAFEELGRVLIEDVLGHPILIIEDVDGILVAALRMDDDELALAEALIERVRRSAEEAAAAT